MKTITKAMTFICLLLGTMSVVWAEEPSAERQFQEYSGSTYFAKMAPGGWLEGEYLRVDGIAWALKARALSKGYITEATDDSIVWAEVFGSFRRAGLLTKDGSVPRLISQADFDRINRGPGWYAPITTGAGAMPDPATVQKAMSDLRSLDLVAGALSAAIKEKRVTDPAGQLGKLKQSANLEGLVDQAGNSNEAKLLAESIVRKIKALEIEVARLSGRVSNDITGLQKADTKIREDFGSRYNDLARLTEENTSQIAGVLNFYQDVKGKVEKMAKDVGVLGEAKTKLINEVGGLRKEVNQAVQDVGGFREEFSQFVIKVNDMELGFSDAVSAANDAATAAMEAAATVSLMNGRVATLEVGAVITIIVALLLFGGGVMLFRAGKAQDERLGKVELTLNGRRDKKGLVKRFSDLETKFEDLYERFDLVEELVIVKKPQEPKPEPQPAKVSGGIDYDSIPRLPPAPVPTPGSEESPGLVGRLKKALTG